MGLESEQVEERVPVSWWRDRPVPAFCHLVWESERIGIVAVWGRRKDRQGCCEVVERYRVSISGSINVLMVVFSRAGILG